MSDDKTAPGKPSSWLISRRTFLILSGCAAAAIGLGQLLKKAGEKLVQPILQSGPLQEKQVLTACLNCSGRCPITVRVVDGRAVHIAGNPLSKASEGVICPRAHIGLQVLYDPDRLRSPLKRTNTQKGRVVDPEWVPVSWEEALSEISSRLAHARSLNARDLLIFQGLTSQSNHDLIRRFAAAYGTPSIISDENPRGEAEKAGRWLADGTYSALSYDLAKSNYVLAFGASLLESEEPLANILSDWGKMRGKPARGKVVVFDPRYSVTAARADEWLPLKPGTDAALALAMANVIISESLYDASFVDSHTTGFEQFRDFVLAEYSPAKVAEITGIGAEVIARIARDFAGTRPAVAWTGRGATAWQNGAYASYAVYCLNALAGSLDVAGGVVYPQSLVLPDLPVPVEDEIAKQGRAAKPIASNDFGQPSLSQVPESILLSSYKLTAIGFESNFNMSQPDPAAWDQAMRSLDFYVHCSPFKSEMAQYADYLLPTTTYLEEWGYELVPGQPSEVRLRQPVVEPRSGAKSLGDIVFELSTRIAPVSASFTGIGDSARTFVDYRTSEIRDELLQRGVWEDADYEYGKYNTLFKTPSGKFEFFSEGYSNLLASKAVKATPLAFLPHYGLVEYLGDEKDYPLHLVGYRPVLEFRNGSQNYPWAQEAYLVMHGRGWNVFAEMNIETARASRIDDGDMVWVESPQGKIKVKARVIEGMRPDVVAIALGQGHYAYGRWQQDIGVNPNDITGASFDRLSGGTASFNTRVRIYRA